MQLALGRESATAVPTHHPPAAEGDDVTVPSTHIETSSAATILVSSSSQHTTQAPDTKCGVTSVRTSVSHLAPASIIAGMRVRKARERKSVATCGVGVSPPLCASSTSNPRLSPSMVPESIPGGGPLRRDTEGEPDGDGWASDDSCPSLRTVAGSSDGEDDEDLPDGFKEALEADIAEFLARFCRE